MNLPSQIFFNDISHGYRGLNSSNFDKICVWCYVSVDLIHLTVAKILSTCSLDLLTQIYWISSFDKSFFEWNMDQGLRKEASNIQISNHKLLLPHLHYFFPHLSPVLVLKSNIQSNLIMQSHKMIIK